MISWINGTTPKLGGTHLPIDKILKLSKPTINANGKNTMLACIN